jgi:hypothetical protein
MTKSFILARPRVSKSGAEQARKRGDWILYYSENRWFAGAFEGLKTARRVIPEKPVSFRHAPTVPRKWSISGMSHVVRVVETTAVTTSNSFAARRSSDRAGGGKSIARVWAMPVRAGSVVGPALAR